MQAKPERQRTLVWFAVLLLALIVLTAGVWSRRSSETGVVLIAAGDIADCDSDGDRATAALVERIPGTVVTLGDNAYPGGTADDFADCYEPTWGRFKQRTRPAAGNHDYLAKDAGPYYEYFGQAAGEIGRGFYSYDLGAWHIIVLNSNCEDVGGCEEGSPQHRWLGEDLAAHVSECTLAYWHHPLFGSSGQHATNTAVVPMWWQLYRAGVDVVLNGHAHNYERLAPLDPKGVVDPRRGIRQFIVGTGGRDLRPLSKGHPASEARNDQTYGVLKLTLAAKSYDWEFIPAGGSSFRDAGSGECH